LSWVGKGQALLVFQRWVLALAKNQMCLTERWLFLYAAQRLVYEALGISKHFPVKPLQILLNVTPLKLALSAQ